MFLNVPTVGVSIIAIILAIWSLFWKAWALWISARQGNKPWFIALLLLNTAGILEIVYIFMFSNDSSPEVMKVKNAFKNAVHTAGSNAAKPSSGSGEKVVDVTPEPPAASGDRKDA